MPSQSKVDTLKTFAHELNRYRRAELRSYRPPTYTSSDNYAEKSKVLSDMLKYVDGPFDKRASLSHVPSAFRWAFLSGIQEGANQNIASEVFDGHVRQGLTYSQIGHTVRARISEEDQREICDVAKQIPKDLVPPKDRQAFVDKLTKKVWATICTSQPFSSVSPFLAAVEPTVMAWRDVSPCLKEYFHTHSNFLRELKEQRQEWVTALKCADDDLLFQVYSTSPNAAFDASSRYDLYERTRGVDNPVGFDVEETFEIDPVVTIHKLEQAANKLEESLSETQANAEVRIRDPQLSQEVQCALVEQAKEGDSSDANFTSALMSDEWCGHSPSPVWTGRRPGQLSLQFVTRGENVPTLFPPVYTPGETEFSYILRLNEWQEGLPVSDPEEEPIGGILDGVGRLPSDLREVISRRLGRHDEEQLSGRNVSTFKDPTLLYSD